MAATVLHIQGTEMTDSFHNARRIGGKSWFPPEGMRLGATIYARRGIPWLKDYLGLPRLDSTLSPEIVGTVAWGGRAEAKIAKTVGFARRLPHWHLEDGFLRSVGLGKAGAKPLSIVADDLALPVNAARASRLETLILEADDATARQGAAVRDAIVHNRLSKYNHLPHLPPKLTPTWKRRLLLVDQVVGDISVPRSMGSAKSFARMLDDAIATGAQCIVRTHPDVMAGYRKGYMAELAAAKPGVILSAEPVSVAAMLETCDEVWTVASQFGFDALLRDKPVRCYAAPFYAGWGLTEDHMSPQARQAIVKRRSTSRTIDHLAAAAYLLYPLYRDPADWRQIDVFAAIDIILAGQSTVGG
jgi:capsular polysaccharide export protein